MATHNANYEAIVLSSGSYTATTTFNEFVCTSAGDLIIRPLLGPPFTWTASAAGQKIQIRAYSAEVSSGAFVGLAESPGTNWTPYRYTYTNATGGTITEA